MPPEPDFSLCARGTITSAFLERKIATFREAAAWVRLLPYGRNTDKTDLSTLFREGRGTCSTKHALLKQLADEHEISEIRLCIGMYKMNGRNTPGAAKTLAAAGLEYLPEAHCYLKYAEVIFDYTSAAANPAEYSSDILEECEIRPDQTGPTKSTTIAIT